MCGNGVHISGTNELIRSYFVFGISTLHCGGKTSGWFILMSQKKNRALRECGVGSVAEVRGVVDGNSLKEAGVVVVRADLGGSCSVWGINA